MTQLRILCLPYAGGGASAFNGLRTEAQSQAEVIPVQFPGRESRYNESVISQSSDMSVFLEREVLPLLTSETIVYGHSMGALIGYSLCAIAKKRGISPLGLCVGAHRSPGEPITHNIDQLDDSALLEYTLGLSGDNDGNPIPEELLPLVMPAIRGDLMLCQSFNGTFADILDIPILAIYGNKDPGTTGTHMSDWKNWTMGPFYLKQCAGDHLYLRSNPMELCSHIMKFRALIDSEWRAPR